ncbi:MAG: TIGR04282 family arsenosugar biosynthesis glycosyltransferase, partial [Pseudomonadota bacterium]|nr:TIGR04282 family arsenosugar biosynthesis glycosyltransferase [Pseudomonadota bacterium]
EPKPGQVKTRLVPALGAQGAAQFAECLLEHAVKQLRMTQVASKQLCVWPDAKAKYWQRFEQKISQQVAGDLGDKMSAAAQQAFAQPGCDGVIFMGMDCPDLSANVLDQVALSLADHDVVIVPAKDGGYVCIGIRQLWSAVFEAMPWSQPHLLKTTLERAKAAGLTAECLDALVDIDEPEDLDFLPRHWMGLVARS